MRTLQFDGVEYLDGTASDPNSMGWMQGHPPPPDRLIRFGDDRFLEFPRNRWALSHLRELVPTVNVWRGSGRSGDLGTPAAADETAIDRMEFDDLNGRRLCWADSLADTYTDGIAVLHRGRLVYERYRGALRRELPHACFSITKSYAATLAATLIHEGVLDPSRSVLHYLPEMAGTAYADATLREVLDMQIGVAYSELYSDPAAQIWQYSRAGGLRPRPAGYQGAGSFYDYLVTLAQRRRARDGVRIQDREYRSPLLGDAACERCVSRRASFAATLVATPMRGGRLHLRRFAGRCDGRRRPRCNASGPRALRRADALRGSIPRPTSHPGIGGRRHPARRRPGKVCDGGLHAASRLLVSRHVVDYSQRARCIRSARDPRPAPVRGARSGDGRRPVRLASDRRQRGK